MASSSLCGQGGQWELFSQVAGRWWALWGGVGRRRCCISRLYSCAGRAGWGLAMDRGNGL